MTTFNQFENRIKGLIKTNQTELEEVRVQQETNKEAIKNAKTSIIQAKKDNNYEAFNNAKKELWIAENQQEFLQDRADALQGKLMTPTEYHNSLEELDSLLEKEIDKLVKKVEPILEQLANVLAEERTIRAKAGQLGDLMQQEIINNEIVYGGYSANYTPKIKNKALITALECVEKYR